MKKADHSHTHRVDDVFRRALILFKIEEHWLLIITGVQASGVIFNGQSLKLPDECGPAISDHKKALSQLTINDSLLKPELLWLLNIFLPIFRIACVQTPLPLSKNRRRGLFSDFYWGERGSVHRLYFGRHGLPSSEGSYIKFYIYVLYFHLLLIRSFIRIRSFFFASWSLLQQLNL